MRAKSIHERLEQFTRPAESGCIEWTGRRDRQGYGIMAICRDGKETKVRAHRAAFEIASGPLPDGACVLHSCDNPSCVNPAHLRAGTRADNAADMVSRGRNTAGTRHPHAKLSAQAVSAIRASSEPQMALAARFGVSVATISRVQSRKVYA